MALEILDGTTAVVSIEVDTAPDSGGSEGTLTGTPLEMKCHFRSAFVEFARSVSAPKITFCSGAWPEYFGGMVNTTYAFSGYVTTGVAYSTPLAFIARKYPCEVGLFLDSRSGQVCSITQRVVFTTDSMAAIHQEAFPRQLTAIGSGEPTTAWVVA